MSFEMPSIYLPFGKSRYFPRYRLVALTMVQSARSGSGTCPTKGHRLAPNGYPNAPIVSFTAAADL